jgi:hypothetical protein
VRPRLLSPGGTLKPLTPNETLRPLGPGGTLRPLGPGGTLRPPSPGCLLRTSPSHRPSNLILTSYLIIKNKCQTCCIEKQNKGKVTAFLLEA